MFLAEQSGKAPPVRCVCGEVKCSSSRCLHSHLNYYNIIHYKEKIISSSKLWDVLFFSKADGTARIIRQLKPVDGTTWLRGRIPISGPAFLGLFWSTASRSGDGPDWRPSQWTNDIMRHKTPLQHEKIQKQILNKHRKYIKMYCIYILMIFF